MKRNLAQTPVVVYGVNLLLAGFGYYVLVRSLVRTDKSGRLAGAIGRDLKGNLSLAFYICGIVAAVYVNVWVAMAFYVAVAVIWFVPDRRMERAVEMAEERRGD